MEDRRESTKTTALTKGCTGDAVAAAASKKAPEAVVVKDFEPSEVLKTHRSRLAAVEQNRPDQGLVNATFDLERYLSLRTKSAEGLALRAEPSPA